MAENTIATVTVENPVGPNDTHVVVARPYDPTVSLKKALEILVYAIGPIITTALLSWLSDPISTTAVVTSIFHALGVKGQVLMVLMPIAAAILKALANWAKNRKTVSIDSVPTGQKIGGVDPLTQSKINSKF